MVFAPKRLVDVVVPDARVQPLPEVHRLGDGAVERRDDRGDEVPRRQGQPRPLRGRHRAVAVPPGRPHRARRGVVREAQHLRQQSAVRRLDVHHLEERELRELRLERGVRAAVRGAEGVFAPRAQVLVPGVREPPLVPRERALVRPIHREGRAGAGGAPGPRDERRGLGELRRVPDVLGEAIDDELARGPHGDAVGCGRVVRRRRLEPEQVPQIFRERGDFLAPRLDAFFHRRRPVGAGPGRESLGSLSRAKKASPFGGVFAGASVWSSVASFLSTLGGFARTFFALVMARPSSGLGAVTSSAAPGIPARASEINASRVILRSCFRFSKSATKRYAEMAANRTVRTCTSSFIASTCSCCGQLTSPVARTPWTAS